MKLLLDSHIFLWWSENPLLLPRRIDALCRDDRNSLILSSVSVWEMQIKHQNGKLTLSQPLRALIAREQITNGLKYLPIAAEHIFALEKLPPNHKDPFDRILIAQSIQEGIRLVSVNSIFENYGISMKY